MYGGISGLKCVVNHWICTTLPSIGLVAQSSVTLCTQGPSVQLPYVVLANSREIQGYPWPKKNNHHEQSYPLGCNHEFIDQLGVFCLTISRMSLWRLRNQSKECRSALLEVFKDAGTPIDESVLRKVPYMTVKSDKETTVVINSMCHPKHTHTHAHNY